MSMTLSQIGWRIRVPVQQQQTQSETITQNSWGTPAPVRQARAEPTIRRGDPVAAQ